MTTQIQHKNLAKGGWQELSLTEQLGNVGSEISRALRWQGKDDKLFQGAIERAFELLYFTLGDPRWQRRLKEIARARELLCDAIFGGKEYKSSLENLERYFFQFALASRLRK